MSQIKKITGICLIIIFSLCLPAQDLIEKIYAVVESEIITYTEYNKRSQGEITRLSSMYKGEELTKKIEELKLKLLDLMIDDKVLLAEAKSRNYQIESDIKTIINQIKEQYGFKTDNELRAEVVKAGLTWADFLQNQKNNRMIGRLRYEEITPEVEKKVDTSHLMDYYKTNKKDFLIEKKVILNAIFLKKELYLAEATRKEKEDIILKELTSKDFLKVAEEFTDMTGDNKVQLGEFKVSELDENMLRVANELKKGEFSKEWIPTDMGHYLIQLKDVVPESYKEYKSVRAEIKKKLMEKEGNILMMEYIKDLRKNAYIKIYK